MRMANAIRGREARINVDSVVTFLVASRFFLNADGSAIRRREARINVARALATASRLDLSVSTNLIACGDRRIPTFAALTSPRLILAYAAF